jgi:hypothetical protein
MCVGRAVSGGVLRFIKLHTVWLADVQCTWFAWMRAGLVAEEGQTHFLPRSTRWNCRYLRIASKESRLGAAVLLLCDTMGIVVKVVC